MKRVLATLFFIFAFMLSLPSLAAPIKIYGLNFDNSDKIIQIKSTGELQAKVITQDIVEPQVNITKGTLLNPTRVYFDITNSTLVGPAKSWSLKNSALESARISQFSLNPNTVRLVLYPSEGESTKDFDAFFNNYQIIIKCTNKKIVENTEFTSIYKNSFVSKSIFENAQNTPDVEKPKEQEPQLIPVSTVKKPVSTPVSLQSKLSSRYYISDADMVQRGILVGGMGEISIKPVIYLSNPDRMVVDIENAVLAPPLRNKSFFFEQLQSSGGDIQARDILRMGQFEKNIVRLVVQGEDAKNYRVVISPDLQNLFIAKRPDILNSKLTNTQTNINSYSAEKVGAVDVLNINFSAPTTFSIFEEGGYFHLDIQNLANANPESYANLLKNLKFTDTKSTRIALDKLRLSFPLEDNEQVDAQITHDARKMKITFKVPPKPAVAPAPPVQVQEKPKEVKEDDKPKARPAEIKNYYKVVIDPGHGGSDVGATRSYIYEKNITLDISNMVVKNLNKQNVFTEMTRDRDKTVQLSERTDFSNEVKPDLFVSIHVNSSVKETIYGVETHWWKDNSIELAKTMHAQMTTQKRLDDWGTIDRGLFKSQFYVINHTECPAVLAEIGFISNPTERSKIIAKKRQEEIAEAITQGIMDYLKKRKK